MRGGRPACHLQRLFWPEDLKKKKRKKKENPASDVMGWCLHALALGHPNSFFPKSHALPKPVSIPSGAPPPLEIHVKAPRTAKPAIRKNTKTPDKSPRNTRKRLRAQSKHPSCLLLLFFFFARDARDSSLIVAAGLQRAQGRVFVIKDIGKGTKRRKGKKEKKKKKTKKAANNSDNP